MSGGGGGGGGSKTEAPKYEPVQESKLQTTGWGGMGPTATPQTFHMGAIPQWMDANRGAEQFGFVPGQQNWFAAPWWGRSAANPAQMLSESDLMYQAPASPQASAPGAAGKAPKKEQQYQPWRDEFGNTDAGRLMAMDYSGMD